MQIQLLRQAVSQLRSKRLWPGFEHQQIPVAVFDGQQTWLWDHPYPPSPFTRHPTQDEVAVMDGKHPDLWANSTALIGGVPTATVLSGPNEPLMGIAATVVHEQFHVFQARKFTDWSPNELELLTYPVADVDVIALRAMETTALSRALRCAHRPDCLRWARTAVRVRTERVAKIPSGAGNYEAQLELLEGLATYVERKAVGDERDNLPLEDWPPESVRLRSYAIGRAWAMLLDRLVPDWQQRLMGNPSRPLYSLTAEAIKGEASAEFAEEEESRFYRCASRAVEKSARNRHQLRAVFLAEPGARLIIEAEGSGLQPAGFDPQNIRLVGEWEVLHTRFLKLKSPYCHLEVTERAALTIGAGIHPLFGGVRQVLLTGFEEPPALVHDGDWAHLVAPGVIGRFPSSGVVKNGERIRIRNN